MPAGTATTKPLVQSHCRDREHKALPVGSYLCPSAPSPTPESLCPCQGPPGPQSVPLGRAGLLLQVPVSKGGGGGQGEEGHCRAQVTDSQVEDEELSRFQQGPLLMGHQQQQGVPRQGQDALGGTEDGAVCVTEPGKEPGAPRDVWEETLRTLQRVGRAPGSPVWGGLSRGHTELCEHIWSCFTWDGIPSPS